jgi:hypothetical protein
MYEVLCTKVMLMIYFNYFTWLFFAEVAVILELQTTVYS